MYQSGCTGDLKTGSYGDLNEALRLENITIRLFYLALGCYVIIYWLLSNTNHLMLKVVFSMVIILLSSIVLFFSFMHFSSLGVRDCY